MVAAPADPLCANQSERNGLPLDPAALMQQVADFGANTLLMGMGGIAAEYPTPVEFHYPSPTFRPAATCSAT